MRRPVSKGFTLIELLVVITIIGLLASVVLASLADSRRVSRDAKRVQEAKQFQAAVELYRNANGSYPCSKTTAPTCVTTRTEVNDATPVDANATNRRNNLRTDLAQFIPALNDTDLSGTVAGATYPNFGSIHYTPTAGYQGYTIDVYGESSGTALCTLNQNKNDC
jgi:prepilin-type N-terminal cleavage/methylation domain-containing protein